MKSGNEYNYKLSGIKEYIFENKKELNFSLIDAKNYIKEQLKNDYIDSIGSLFVKYGFNGSRSLVASTIGIELGIMF